MQENQSTVSSEQSTVNTTPSTVSNPLRGHRSPNSFLVILLSILLFVALTIAGFFAFQTQQLVNELRVMSDELKQTPTPIAYTEPTPDPTTDWKTYTDTLHKLVFSYPKDYSFQKNQNSYYIMSPLLPPEKGYELRDGELKVELYFNPSADGDTLEKFANEIRLNFGSNILAEEKININSWEVVHFQSQGHGDSDLYILINDGFRIQIAKYPIKTSRQFEFDQILSTFKFIN